MSVAARPKARNYERACHYRPASRSLSWQSCRPSRDVDVGVFSLQERVQGVLRFTRRKSMSDLVMGRARGIDMLSWYK
jgi:hypothetical protein